MAKASNFESFSFRPDPSVYIELFNWCCGNYGKSNISIELSKKFNRKPTDQNFEDKIESIWKQRVKELPSLFNGSKFRLQSACLENGQLNLRVGLTCYRDFICTNMNRRECEFLREWGRVHYDDPHACFADPVGVNALLVSRDEKFVFVRRSAEVAEAQGQYHGPGGHPEPHVVHGMLDKGDEKELEGMNPSSVVYEFFYSIVKETRDEVNIPEDCLSWPVLIGILRNIASSNGRPELCFLIRCSLNSEEIKQYYHQGGPEAYESTEIVFVKIKDFEQWDPSNDFRNICGQMTVSSKASLHMYFQHQHCHHGKS